MTNRESAPPLLHLPVEVRLEARADACDAVGKPPLLRLSCAFTRRFGCLIGGFILGDTRMPGHPCETDMVARLQCAREEGAHSADRCGGGVAGCYCQNGSLGVGGQTKIFEGILVAVVPIREFQAESKRLHLQPRA